MIPPMLPTLLATLTLLAPLAGAEEGSTEEPLLQVDTKCVYQVPYPPFIEIRECDDEEVQTLKLL